MTTIKGALEILKKHNQWRRGVEIEMINTATLGKAIDLIVNTFEEIPKMTKQ